MCLIFAAVPAYKMDYAWNLNVDYGTVRQGDTGPLVDKEVVHTNAHRWEKNKGIVPFGRCVYQNDDMVGYFIVVLYEGEKIRRIREE